ncbi:hypothetical protein AVDCRST_MAG81-3205, partial [uncultured Synechococcales cyanobacterium]
CSYLNLDLRRIALFKKKKPVYLASTYCSPY